MYFEPPSFDDPIFLRTIRLFLFAFEFTLTFLIPLMVACLAPFIFIAFLVVSIREWVKPRSSTTNLEPRASDEPKKLQMNDQVSGGTSSIKSA